MKLIRLADLDAFDVRAIWRLVGAADALPAATVAWSFEGKGIRTRTTFIQAFRELGLAFTELPDLLNTAERPADLAGYLDPFYALYVIRAADHARLAEFAAASRRPVINAMSSAGHPCEVLTDAHYIDTQLRPIQQARIGLWGPPTNVLRSWHELAAVLGFTVQHVCAPRFHEDQPHVAFAAAPAGPVDVLITDGWPAGCEDSAWSLTRAQLALLGDPKLLPTPPFSIGRELAFDPLGYPGFLGYAQKQALLPVHKAIIRWALEHEPGSVHLSKRHP
jgi:ornithine carbamoyltransferase